MEFGSHITLARVSCVRDTLLDAAGQIADDAVSGTPTPGQPAIPPVRDEKDYPVDPSDAQLICLIGAYIDYLMKYIECVLGPNPTACEASAWDAYCQAWDDCVGA